MTIESEPAMGLRGAGTGRVVLDLSGVDYLDSVAISALFTHADDLHLVVNPLLVQALTITGLTELAPVDIAPG